MLAFYLVICTHLQEPKTTSRPLREQGEPRSEGFCGLGLLRYLEPTQLMVCSSYSNICLYCIFTTGIHQLGLIIVASLPSEEMEITFSRRCLRWNKFILLTDLFREAQKTHPQITELLRQVSSHYSIKCLVLFEFEWTGSCVCHFRNYVYS